MSDRMTDKRLDEIKNKRFFTTPKLSKLCAELLQALKAERESLNACAKANTDLRLRIEELEAIKQENKILRESNRDALADCEGFIQRIAEVESGLRECREAVKHTGSYESVTKLVDALLGDEV